MAPAPWPWGRKGTTTAWAERGPFGSHCGRYLILIIIFNKNNSPTVKLVFCPKIVEPLNVLLSLSNNAPMGHRPSGRDQDRYETATFAQTSVMRPRPPRDWNETLGGLETETLKPRPHSCYTTRNVVLGAKQRVQKISATQAALASAQCRVTTKIAHWMTERR